MEEIGQLTSNRGGSGNSGMFAGLYVTGSGDGSVWKCRADVSMCAAKEFDPALHVRVCLCITHAYALDAQWLFGFPFGVKTRMLFCDIMILI